MRVFWGKWDSWGLEISWCNSDKTFTVSLIHWYFALCFWKLWKFDSTNDCCSSENCCDEFEILDKDAYTDKMNG